MSLSSPSLVQDPSVTLCLAGCSQANQVELEEDESHGISELPRPSPSLTLRRPSKAVTLRGDPGNLNGLHPAKPQIMRISTA